MEWSAIISVGQNLYAISANIEKAPYSNVPFLDSRTNTWLEAPRMQLAQTEIFEGNMYLPKTSEKPDSLNCVEVYNTKTQTWKLVPPERRIFQLLNLEGKVYKNFDLVSARKGLTFHFTPTHLECGLVGLNTDSYGRSRCMIENKSYRYKNGKFTWKEFDDSDKKAVSRKLEGLEGLPKFASYCTIKLVDYGGKLVVLWDKYVPASWYKEKMIWCAEISLKKRNSKEIWGKVEWFGAVLKVPRSYKILCAIDASL